MSQLYYCRRVRQYDPRRQFRGAQGRHALGFSEVCRDVDGRPGHLRGHLVEHSRSVASYNVCNTHAEISSAVSSLATYISTQSREREILTFSSPGNHFSAWSMRFDTEKIGESPRGGGVC